MKNKYYLLISIIVIALITGIVILLIRIPINKEGTYKTLKQSQETKTIIYPYNKFKTELIKIGFVQAKCNDDKVSGMENIVCAATKDNNVLQNVDSLNFTYNGDVIETLILKLNYESFDSKTVKRDIKAIINNFIVLNLEEKTVVQLKEKLDRKNTVHGSTTSLVVGDYYTHYNLKEHESENDNYYSVSVTMYLKATPTVE